MLPVEYNKVSVISGVLSVACCQWCVLKLASHFFGARAVFLNPPPLFGAIAVFSNTCDHLEWSALRFGLKTAHNQMT